MHDAPPDWAWGDWVIGDLADTLRKVSELIGRRAVVLRANVEPPSDFSELPHVRLWVDNALAAYRVRQDLLAGDHPVTLLGQEADTRWDAEVAGLHLTVVVSGAV